jgi:hypothetical protein
MTEIYVAKQDKRQALYLPMGGTKENPSLMFFLPEMVKSQLDEYVRKELSEQGITDEPTIKKILDEAEKQYELRVKIKETQKELKRLREIKAKGGRLMQVGFRKWKQVFYPSVSKEV